jgi:hypothetical protein
MTQYPSAIDNSTTLPPANSVDAPSINANIGATIEIETVLGILPAGPYSTVRTRMDILESRINNPYAPGPNVTNPFYIGGTPISGVSIRAGFGDPTITLPSAIPGSLYLREDGYTNQELYTFGTDGLWHQVLSASSVPTAVIFPTRTITVSYTVDSITSDYSILCNASGAINVTLPLPTTAGRQLVIKDITGLASTRNITILPHSSETIDGASSRVISTNYSSISVLSDSQNWYII